MSTRRVTHVFPFDPGHLSQDPRSFADLMLRRWPLAAIAASRLAASSSVHLIGRYGQDRSTALKLVHHPSLFSGPRFREWGDDWSVLLGSMLRRLGGEDVCVLHLNDYAAARYAHRAAHRTRVVLVFHGLGLGRSDDHLLTADRHVVLRRDAADGLRELGVDSDRIVVMHPSVDKSLFRPATSLTSRPVLGFIGRLEESKGVFEIPRVLQDLPDTTSVELVGTGSPEQVAALWEAASEAGVEERLHWLGELPPEAMADRLRRWRLLLLPSYTEGSPIVVAEAASARVPTVAVEGVLPDEVARRPGIHVGARSSYSALVAAVLADEDRPPPAEWVKSHEDAALEWDTLLESLPQWTQHRLVATPRLERLKRFKPLRRLVRLVRRKPRI